MYYAERDGGHHASEHPRASALASHYDAAVADHDADVLDSLTLRPASVCDWQRLGAARESLRVQGLNLP